MKKKTTVELIASSSLVSLYSISFEMDGTTEFERFVMNFERNAVYHRDYQRIVAALQVILYKGALERFFRPEGKMNDNVQALPLNSGRLRLYCLRLSDEILVIGNGGVKPTRTYEESPLLYGYVLDLQNFERLLKDALATGSIRIEEKRLTGIDDKVFEI